jgi:hypothetical protein
MSGVKYSRLQFVRVPGVVFIENYRGGDCPKTRMSLH